jgi:hypothetical protein
LSALQKNFLKLDPDKYLEDIIKVTCLLLREGEDYRFIHKSVQEYYTSAFIKHRPEPIAKKFCDALLQKVLPGNWRQELHFLSEIDRYRFNKYYYLPHLCGFLGVDPGNIPRQCPALSADITKSILGRFEVGFNLQGPNMRMISFRYLEELFEAAWHQFVAIDYKPVLEAYQQGRLQPVEIPSEVQPTPLGHPDRRYFSVGTILEAGLLQSQITKIAEQLLDAIYVLVRKTEAAILREESLDLQLPI